MLLRFSVENYLSFRDRVTLSAVASSGSSMPENVLKTKAAASLRVLNNLAVFGANASGKSNLILALGFMKQFVLTSSREGDKRTLTGISPFKLDDRYHNRPSVFEVDFVWEGVRHVYGFAARQAFIEEEWFLSYPLGQPRLVFERSHNRKTKEPRVKFGSGWVGQRKILERATRPNALFVSVAAQLNSDVAQLVHDWFSKKLQIVSWLPTIGPEQAFTSEWAAGNPTAKQAILDYLQQADPGIRAFAVKKTGLFDSQQFRKLPEELKKQLAADYPQDVLMFEVSTSHARISKKGEQGDIQFDFDEESDGTQKFYALAGPWTYALENGCVLVVDELDARLHPLLTLWLIELFRNEKTNRKGAQLVFTTHDDNLLERARLRRDQFWFTEKNDEGATSLYSLSDFKGLRQGENIRKGYLAGRYGAVPWVETVTS